VTAGRGTGSRFGRGGVRDSSAAEPAFGVSGCRRAPTWTRPTGWCRWTTSRSPRPAPLGQPQPRVPGRAPCSMLLPELNPCPSPRRCVARPRGPAGNSEKERATAQETLRLESSSRTCGDAGRRSYGSRYYGRQQTVSTGDQHPSAPPPGRGGPSISTSSMAGCRRRPHRTLVVTEVAAPARSRPHCNRRRPTTRWICSTEPPPIRPNRRRAASGPAPRLREHRTRPSSSLPTERRTTCRSKGSAAVRANNHRPGLQVDRGQPDLYRG